MSERERKEGLKKLLEQEGLPIPEEGIMFPEDRTEEEAQFDNEYYLKVWNLLNIVRKHRDLDEAIVLWREGAAFIQAHFAQIKGGHNRPYDYIYTGGMVSYSIIGMNSIHFFLDEIVKLLVDAGRFEDAYRTYFELKAELSKSPDMDETFFAGGAWHFKWSEADQKMVLSDKREKFQLHTLFKEVKRQIKYHGKSLADYPFIDPQYHAQIQKIRVRTPKLKHPYLDLDQPGLTSIISVNFKEWEGS